MTATALTDQAEAAARDAARIMGTLALAEQTSVRHETRAANQSSTTPQSRNGSRWCSTASTTTVVRYGRRPPNDDRR